MDEKLVPIISVQTDILFSNIEEILKSIKESELHDKKICDWPLGEQIFHLLHSMDQWFINPNIYQESGIALLERQTGKRLAKSELTEYYLAVKNKIMDYLAQLDPKSLTETPPNCQFARLALILGQYRHFMYHIGLIHGCLRMHTGGKSPNYFGLGASPQLLAGDNS